MKEKPIYEMTSIGNKIWILNGEYHREDGPAIEYTDGTKCWYIHGEYHREDGPALEYPDGRKYWFFNGKKLTEEEFNKIIKKRKKKSKKKDKGKILEVFK